MNAACDTAHEVILENPLTFTYHCGKVRLEVDAHESTRLIKFYETCGFACRYPNVKDVRNGFVDKRISFGRSFFVPITNDENRTVEKNDDILVNEAPCADIRAVVAEIVDKIVLENTKLGQVRCPTQPRKRTGLRFGSHEILSPKIVRHIPRTSIKVCSLSLSLSLTYTYIRPFNTHTYH